MTDTPNHPTLSSAEEFDARLKRTDEDRWLASRYAPEEARRRLVAVYLLNQELQRALQAKEPMLSKIRIQWWRETLEGFGGTVRRHDLSLELAEAAKGRPLLLAAMMALVDRYDDVADDHLSGGHAATAEHEAAHYAAEAQLMRTAGLALREPLTEAESEALARVGEAHLARVAGMSDAEARWSAARKTLRFLLADLWPAVGHVAASMTDKPFAKRWRLLSAVFLRRL